MTMTHDHLPNKNGARESCCGMSVDIDRLRLFIKCHFSGQDFIIVIVSHYVMS